MEDLKNFKVGAMMSYENYLIKVSEVDENAQLISAAVFNKSTSKVDMLNNVALKELWKIVGYIPQSGEIRHQKFGEILLALQKDEPVYLYGAAGSGKNVVAQQLANELGLQFYFSNCITLKHEIEGYGNAVGELVGTPFFDAFTKGGLFMFDEFDASAPEAVIVLNAALANGYYNFPVIGNVEKHKDFRVIAAGNTTGRGANEVYNGRSKIDAATLDRFTAIRFEYDPNVERKLAKGNDEIIDFIHALRKACKRTHVYLTLGYRAIIRMVKYTECYTPKTNVDVSILKGMDIDEMEILNNELRNLLNTSSNRYYLGFLQLLDELKNEL